MELYIFYGEEDFLREYNANKVIGECNLSNPSMNFVKLDDETISKLPDNCEQMPFCDEKKVILVKNSGLFASSKKVSPSVSEKVVEYLLNLPDYAIVVFNEESVDKRLTPYKKLSKVGKFEELKYRGTIDLANWICSGMKKCNAVIDIEDAKYLADSCGPSMSYLYSEIKKLAVLNNEGEKITKDLINEVCVKSMQGIIFDLTDAIGNKDKKKSLILMNELILKKEAEQFILIMLYKHFRNLFLLRVATDEGRASADELSINPYVYRKLLGQVKNYEKNELRNILRKLVELDVKSKKGEVDLRIGLEVLLTVWVK